MITEFLAAEKVAATRLKFPLVLDTNSAKAQTTVIVPSRPTITAAFVIVAHVETLPEKYAFSLLLGGERVAGLDVNPTAGHVNYGSGRKVNVAVTHWHKWPSRDVEPDLRNRRFRSWLDNFCKVNLIDLSPGCDTPPHYGGMQPRML